MVESWYLSANIVEGRVRYVCNEHVVSSEEGEERPERGIDSFRVGCTPVGGGKEA